MRRKTAVLISGRGSNMRSLVAAAASKDFPAVISLVISNKKDAPGLVFAEEAGIPCAIVSHKDFDSRESFDRAIDSILHDHGIQMVCLAGFMRLLTPWFVEKWRNRLINVHPSLLPAFRGLETHARAIAEKAPFAGCSVHFVRPELDHGPVILQAATPVFKDDDAEQLAARVLLLEHRIYPLALRLVAGGFIRLEKDDQLSLRAPT